MLKQILRGLFQFLMGSWIFACGQLVHATTLVVSDIDDTIKISRVLHSSEMVQNAFLTSNVFLGMPELYRLLADDPQVEFVYLSNAIKSMMQGQHELFISKNHFPEGRVILRENPFEKNHKVKTFRRLVELYQPSRVVLIGDNGELDSKFAEQVSLEFPWITTEVYIHQIYSVRSKDEKGKPLQLAQKGFATAADLALNLRESGLISASQSLRLLDEILPQILIESEFSDQGTLAFPIWMDCRDFILPTMASFDTGLAGPFQTAHFELYLKKLELRCGREPLRVVRQRTRPAS